MDSSEFNKINEDFFEKLPEHVSVITKVWGPPTWFFLHSMAMAYPKKIDKNDPEHIEIRNSMYAFLSNLGSVLPCGICGASYENYIKTPELSISRYLNSRADLVHFIYLIHERVNEKLGVPKCDRPSFSEVVKYYNKFRAHGPCNATTEEERLNSLMAGCGETEIKKGKFKNYKCIVNVVNKNDNKSEYVKETLKENFGNIYKSGNGNNDNDGNNGNIVKKSSGINLFLLFLSISLTMIIIFLLMKRK